MHSYSFELLTVVSIFWKQICFFFTSDANIFQSIRHFFSVLSDKDCMHSHSFELLTGVSIFPERTLFFFSRSRAKLIIFDQSLFRLIDLLDEGLHAFAFIRIIDQICVDLLEINLFLFHERS